MKTCTRAAAVVALPLVLTACGGFEFQHMGDVKPVDDPFYNALYASYLTRAEHEQSYGHYVSADAYAIKARAAAGGEDVEMFTPDDASNFPDGTVPATDRDVMMSSRDALAELLEAGASKVASIDSANAQVMYDCWIEEQSYIDDFNEDNQPDHAAFCRHGFNRSLALVQDAMKAKPAPKVSVPVVEPMPPLQPAPEPEAFAQVPNSYLVFFDWDSVALSGDAMQVINQTVNNVRRGKVTQIVAVGHADTSGSTAYNEGLSRRRAETVASALVAHGIPRNQITIGAKGEEEPLVPTGDGIREAQNRRVVVTFPGR